MKKKKISISEQGDHEKDVTFMGNKYRLRVHDKVGADGVVETHLDYDSHDKPRRSKRKPTCRYNPVTRKWYMWSDRKGTWVLDKRPMRGI